MISIGILYRIFVFLFCEMYKMHDLEQWSIRDKMGGVYCVTIHQTVHEIFHK